VLASGYLVWSATGAASVYYLTVSELGERGESLQGRSVRVQGRIADDSIVTDNSRLWIRFVLTDGEDKVSVSYADTPPDMLGYSDEQKYQEVIVEGRIDRSGVLQASNLLVQHGPEFQAVDDLSLTK
tara:strand:+ start:202 stop:582 length:381 start_codon:yes stop_codon:yes gene_type:complete